MALLATRFDDPETERAFLTAERGNRAGAIRALIIIGIATVLGYMLLNPLHFPPEGVAAYVRAGTTLILFLASYWLLSRTAFYLDNPWVDLPLYLLLGAVLGWVSLVLANLSGTTGFPPHVMVMIQMGMLMVFASVGFAATFRWFLLWSALVLWLFVWWLTTRDDVTGISRIYALSNFSTFFIFAIYFNWDTERRARDVFAANLALDAEKAKTEALLYNVLPQEVAGRLRAGEAVADAFTDVAVVFVDLVGFSRLARRLSPGHLVRLLNAYFSAGDRCSERHGLEKVKTIGDAYLAVAGGMASRDTDAPAAIGFARDLIAELATLSAEYGITLEARIGLHVGPVVGGVIGSQRLAYDYWGDTMNVASRLQSVAPPNGIAISEAAWLQVGSLLTCEAQNVMLKGVGETEVYVAALGAD